MGHVHSIVSRTLHLRLRCRAQHAAAPRLSCSSPTASIKYCIFCFILALRCQPLLGTPVLVVARVDFLERVLANFRMDLSVETLQVTTGDVGRRHVFRKLLLVQFRVLLLKLLHVLLYSAIWLPWM